MDATDALSIPWRIQTQPRDVRGLSMADGDALIVSIVQVDGKWRILSRYGDPDWEFHIKATNSVPYNRFLRFSRIPEPFRATMKAVIYRYIRRGKPGSIRPDASTARVFLERTIPFLRHLIRIGVPQLRDVSPLACRHYVDACKSQDRGRNGKPLSVEVLHKRLTTIEAIYELSQFTDDPMPMHPWPDTTAACMAGLAGLTGKESRRGGKTPLIPDAVFSKLFQIAWECISRADWLLTVRDELVAIEAQRIGQSRSPIFAAKNRRLLARGWSTGLAGFSAALTDLRTACYVVVASLSGCRNHELAFVRQKACYRTEGNDGEVYWWMRSQSLKTDEGHTEWMIPGAAVRALEIMDRWAEPYQLMLTEEIERRRAADPADPEIAVAQQHIGAVFLGIDKRLVNQVRTLSGQAWNLTLKEFMHRRGLDWAISTHQFRRTFANYAARSQFGDLRYLKEHFKHWSMDMTLGYALNGSQEMDLFYEIQDELDDIKEGVVEQWLKSDEPLAGGYGRGIMAWRGSNEVTLFKDRRSMVRSIAESTAIRSNGHAWCTADDNQCVGNGGLDSTRCTGCNNAVISRAHAHIYQGMYDHLKEVVGCNDIGASGLSRVQRDLSRCRDVLQSLGYDPEGQRP